MSAERPFETWQERQMEKFDERTIDEMTVAELEFVSGGRIRWIDIHMPYNDFIKWPGGDPSPTRYA
jgi:hypothetical protein